MRLSDPMLHEAIAARRVIADPVTRARIDNLWFEERVNHSRQVAFEEVIGSLESWVAFEREHRVYQDTYVRVGAGLIPPTFAADFVVRDFSGIDP